jgi:hypothetical protein
MVGNTRDGPRLPPVCAFGAEAVLAALHWDGARQVAIWAALRPALCAASRHALSLGMEAGLAREGDELALDGA